MLYGYTGKIARVDLTNQTITYDQIDEETARKYIGGVGIAAKILWDETDSKTDPFSPENRLIFMGGPLGGSSVPESSRYIVAGISPLTGIWGEAHSGGNWEDELRHAGFDGVVVQGQASRPVYIWLHEGKAEIRDASHLWGKDTYETDEILKKEIDNKISVACIGRAGERLVRLACVMNDGRMGRAAARCGLGALMGSKKLKAIVAKGTMPLTFYDQEKLKEAARKVHAQYPRKRDEEVEYQVRMLKSLMQVGSAPVKNWREGNFEPGNTRLAEHLLKAKFMQCKRCPFPCVESHWTLDGERNMVWEHWAPLGTNCMLDDPEALQQAYSLCSRYGLDSISTGIVVAFAMECFEKGLLTKKDADGIDLTWGNHEAMLEVVRKIGEREGVGELLGDGVKRAAGRIGGLAPEYAIHVKGLEFAGPDPRASMALAVEYATESIGAGHVEAITARLIENVTEGASPLTIPELGYPVHMSRFSPEGKGELTAKMQNFGCVLNSLGVCCFLTLFNGVQASQYVDMIRAATGWDMDLDEMMLIGERIANLKRMFNVRRGISRKDDTLPPRILTHKRGSGGAADSLPFLGKMLNEYYSYRGWSEEGIPTKGKLNQLGLQECVHLGM